MPVSPKKESPAINPTRCHAFFARHVITTLFLVLISFSAGLYFAKIGLFSPVQFTEEEVVATKTVEPVIENEKKTYDEGYQEALAMAYRRIAEDGFASPLDEPVKSLRGRIKSIDGSKLVLEYNKKDLFYFEEGMGERTVVITKDTLIQKGESVPAAEGFDAFYQEYLSGLGVGQKPAPTDILRTLYLENSPKLVPSESEGGGKMGLSDLKSGDFVTVRTTSDVKKADSFDAVSIYLGAPPNNQEGLNDLRNDGNVE
jgi:hypothetical protein